MSTSLIFYFAFENYFRMCQITLNPRESDRLEGASSFVPWNLSFQMFMEEADL